MVLLHADQKARDSLACDVMEPVRTVVDRWLWQYLQAQTFTRRDFYELERGTARLSPVLVQRLSENGFTSAKGVGRWVEEIAKVLGESLTARSTVPTINAQTNRSNGRVAYRNGETRASVLAIPTAPRCHECGAELPSTERVFCDDSLPEQRREQRETFVALGPAALAKLRIDGRDPAHGGEVGRKRGESNAKRAAERAVWEAEHGDGAAERERFKREILPKLAVVALSRIVEVTGMSLRYASLVRRGLYIPHPMHYDPLGRLVDSSDS